MIEQSIQTKICNAVDTGFGEQIDFTSELVRFPSTRGNERPLQQWMAKKLTEFGYTVDHWKIAVSDIEGLPGYSPVCAPFDNAFNTVGVFECPAPKGKSLIINGHVDVVPPGPADMWASPPFEPRIDDGWLYGRGAGDMKAGLVAGIFAMEAIKQAGYRPAADVTVQSVIEEESTGAGALACVQRGYKADLAFIPEPFSERLVRAQVGVVWFKVKIAGRPTHAAYATTGSNAIDSACGIIAALREMEEEWNASHRRHPLYAEHHHPINLNIGEIEGGDWPSSVPGWCTIDVRVGIYPGQLPKDACREIEDVIFEASKTDPFLAENPPQIVYHGYLAEGCVLEGAEDAETLLEDIHTQICGGGLEEFLATGLTDGRFFALYQDTPALNYGPVAENYHGYDERVDIASIKRVTKTMALFIAEWCQLEAL